MQEWLVSAAVIEREGRVLLVANRRRSGLIDWSTPGGVIDEGESVLEGLGREVTEETGLVVTQWSEMIYEVEVSFVDMRSHLRVVTHRAEEWKGELLVADPDGIVVDADWLGEQERTVRLETSPRWVSEPLLAWLDDPEQQPALHRYRVRGLRMTDAVVVRL